MKRNGPPVMLIALIAVSVALLVLANTAYEKAGPKSTAELQREEAEAQAKAQQGKSPADNKPAEDPMEMRKKQFAKMYGADKELVTLSPDTELGPKDAKHSVVVGFSWTPELQADQTPMMLFLSNIRQMPGVKVRIVNVDAVPSAPSGIQVDGKPVAALRDDGNLTNQDFTAAMDKIR